MQAPTLRSVTLTLLAYMVVSFAVQAASHFGINAAHYAAIPIMRVEPIVPLGLLAMVIQGVLAGVLFPAVRLKTTGLKRGIFFAWLLGAFLVSYIVLAEPAKYEVPSVAAWMRVEGVASLLQFTLFGILLSLIHRPEEPNTVT